MKQPRKTKDAAEAATDHILQLVRDWKGGASASKVWPHLIAAEKELAVVRCNLEIHIND